MTDSAVNRPAISVHALERFPYYLNYLKSLDKKNIKSVSAPVIIRDDNYIRIQAPLSFAYDYA